MDDKLKKVVSSIIKDFQKKNKRDPKDLKELALFVLSLGGKKYIERKTQEVLGKLSQEQTTEQTPEQTPEQKLKALHGAKLNYFKSLKHQCAEDEEVVYYKKGGSVKCGCKKKENGGEVKKDCGGSAIKKFKMQFGNKMMQLAEANKERKKKEEQAKKRKGTWAETTDFIPGEKGILKPSLSKETKEDKIYNSGKETVLESSLTKKKEVKKEDKNALKRQLKQDLAPSEKCGGKVKKHQKGSVIAKFKMHRLGGSLNGIPFMQKGTSEGGVKYYPEDEFSGWDLVPFVGSARDIRRAYHNPSTGNIINAGISTAGDALGLGAIGAVAKVASKYNKIAKALKAKGFFRPTGTGTEWIKVGTKKTPINAGKFGTIGVRTEPAVYTKTVPEVDITAPVMWGFSSVPARTIKSSLYELNK